MSNNQTTKVCAVCKKAKEFSFFNLDRRSKDLLQTRCKECFAEYRKLNKARADAYNKAYYGQNVEAIKDHNKSYYLANKERISIVKKEYATQNAEKLREYYSGWREKNKDILRAKKAEYAKANPDKIKKYRKEYFKNPQKYENTLAKAKEWRIRNIELVKRTTKAYKQSAKGKTSAINYTHRRRAKLKQSDVTTSQLLELKQNAKVCYWCGVSLKKASVHIDHYVPLSKGGLHTLSNLVVCCDRCNLSKNASDPIMFANSIGKLL